jgi:hypothetical protein
MDIRNVSQEEKDRFISRAINVFNQIRNALDTLEIDMKKEDLMIQASAVWISGNLCIWFNDFMEQIRHLDKQKDEIQKQIQNAAENYSVDEDESKHEVI